MSRFGCCDDSDVADVGSHDSVLAVLAVLMMFVRGKPSPVAINCLFGFSSVFLRFSSGCHPDVIRLLSDSDVESIRMLNRFGCDDSDVADVADSVRLSRKSVMENTQSFQFV